MSEFDAAQEELIRIRDEALNEAHRVYDEGLAALRREHEVPVDEEPAPDPAPEEQGGPDGTTG
jgi:hypothetical protein